MITGTGARRLALTLATIGCAPLTCHAQITLDGTLGAAGALSGPNYAITAGFGRQVGSNLFHSFGQFNVLTGQSATFSGPGAVTNIIGRVTGGSASNIDGLLRSTISGANLFLINPGGLMFGPNASLDLSGSFHASTASYLKLGASGRFDAATPAASVLTTAAPSAFGFAGTPAGAIVVDGSILQTAPGKTLSLVGGNVTLADAWLDAPGGRINLASLASAGEMQLTATGIAGPGSAQWGTITAARSDLTVDSVGALPAGRIVIRGGGLALDDTVLSSTNSATGAAGGIAVELSGDLTMRGDSVFFSESASAGAAGDISVKARNIAFLEGSQISTSTFGPGRGGSISLTASNAIEFSGTGISGLQSGLFSIAESRGDAGNIAISAAALTLDDAILTSSTEGHGAAGNLTVLAERVALLNGGQITASSFGAGRGGLITITASGSVTLAGRGAEGFHSGLFSTAHSTGNAGGIAVFSPALALNDAIVTSETNDRGAAGDVTISSGRVSLLNGSEITSSSSGAGRAGSLIVSASESITLDSGSLLASDAGAGGNAGRISIGTPALAMNDGLVTSSTGGRGTAGIITVQAERAVLLNGSQVSASSFGSGAGGSITVAASEWVVLAGENAAGNTSGLFSTANSTGNAGSILVSTPSLIMDNAIMTSGTTSRGAGGNVTVRAGRVLLENGSSIGSSTFGAGHAGSVTVEASESVILALRGAGGFRSGLHSFSDSSGNAGGITVVAPLLLIDDAIITSETKGGGAAGDVNVRAGKISVVNGGQIVSSSSGAGAAGSIVVTASESLSVFGRNPGGLPSGLSSATSSSGDAGNIVINAPTLVVDDGSIRSNTSGTGAAGAVTIQADRVTLATGGQISTRTSDSGRGGTVAITASGSVFIGGGKSPDGLSSALFSNADGSGNAGIVSVSSPVLAMDGGFISSDTGGSGAAGNVSVRAGRVLLSNGAQIVASSFDAGRGGQITVTAAESVSLSGRGASGFSSGLFSAAHWTGDAGGILVTTPVLAMNNAIITSESSGRGNGGIVSIQGQRISLANGSQIRSSSSAAGLAGNVVVHTAESLQLTGDSAITTEAARTDGGNIHITARDLVYLRDSRITTAVGTGEGSGGNITIDPTFVVLDNSRIIANAFGGSGGNITIVSDFFLKSPDSLVQASSRFGLQGSISVSAPNVDVSAGLAVLPSAFFDASSMMRASCSARAARASNSFTGAARGGLPAGPERFGFGAYSEGTAGALAAVGGEGMAATTVQLACLR